MLINLYEEYKESYRDIYPTPLVGYNSPFFIEQKSLVAEAHWANEYDVFNKLLGDSEGKWFISLLLGVIQDLPKEYLSPLLAHCQNLNNEFLAPVLSHINRIYSFVIVEAEIQDIYESTYSTISKSILHGLFFYNIPELDLNWNENNYLQPEDTHEYNWTGQYYEEVRQIYDRNLHEDVRLKTEQALIKRYEILSRSLLEHRFSENQLIPFPHLIWPDRLENSELDNDTIEKVKTKLDRIVNRDFDVIK